MKSMVYLLPAVTALIVSFISSRYLFVGSALSLLPWGALALLWGFVAPSNSQALRLGAIYGFSQAFIFLWVDKAGKTTVVQFFILLVIISALGLLAGGCAAIVARLGYAAKTRFRNK